MARTAGAIWIASRDERLQQVVWTALASQKMTPVSAATDLTLEAALADLAARGGAAAAAILDLAWIVSDRLDVSGVIRALRARDGTPAVFPVAATSRRIPENAARWVRTLGARAALPRLDQADQASVERAVEAISEGLSPGGPDLLQLRTQLRASGSRFEQAPESVVQALTGKSAGSVAEELAAGVEIADRSYGMKRYPQCFIGARGAAWLAARYGLDRSAAVSVGRALVRLGYVHHVLKEHDFEDEHLFYRVAPTGRYERVELPALIKLLRQADGLIADRTWRATTYRSCFVGSETVDLVTSQLGLTRAEATALVQCLVDLGVVRHVTGEHDFTDGMYYFRFLAE